MQKRSSESRKIALSGVFGSLAAVLMPVSYTHLTLPTT